METNGVEHLSKTDPVLARLIMMFNLGRPDVLPVHDLGVRKGFQVAYRKRALPEPEQLERYGKRWAPHRSTAARYLWRAADTLGR